MAQPYKYAGFISYRSSAQGAMVIEIIPDSARWLQAFGEATSFCRSTTRP